MVHKYRKTTKKTELHNIILPDTIIKVQIRNICETASKEHQGSQLLSKSIYNMDYIIINQSHTIQSQFFQVLATVRNMADCLPT